MVAPDTLKSRKTVKSNKLRSSGLSALCAKKLGIALYSAARTAKLQDHYREALSLFIPYYDLQGKRTTYHRVRYMETVGFGAGRKYDCPKGHPPQAYFPKTLDWQSIIKDVSRTITITEGELKAACAARNKIECIGLGGVWSWKSKKLGMSFLPELEAFEWEGRRVEICYDSDIADKIQVRSALIALSRELVARGAECSMVILPNAPNGDKLGLDDYIVLNGVKKFVALERLPIQEDEATKQDLFSNWVYVKVDDDVLDFSGGDVISYRSRAHFMNATQHLRALNDDDKMKPAATLWYNDPSRHVVHRRVFDPGTTERFTQHGPNQIPCLNVYRGLAVEPRRGDVGPMLKLIDVLVDGRSDLRHWLLQWLAYPLQKPGTKLQQCVYIYSVMQGVGKSALGEVMLDIYGRFTHGTMLSEDDFFGAWNSWIESNLFAFCDDLSFDGSKKSRASFKRAITAESLELSAKYRTSMAISNRCNFYFTGNSPGGLPLESSGTNRRALILEIRKELGTHWFTNTFDHWRKSNGPSHWLWYLLNYDTSGFAVHGNALDTAETELAVESTRSVMEGTIANQMLDGGAFAAKKVWSAKQLYALIPTFADTQRAPSMSVMARALYANGWKRFGQIRASDTPLQVYWVAPNSQDLMKFKPSKLLQFWRDSHFPGEVLKSLSKQV